MAEGMRLVDANDLWHKTFVCDEVAEVRKFILNAPTVDTVEVVHGRWRRFINGDGEYKYLCGVCEKIVTYEMGGANYCPNCGADMRGETE